MKQFQFSLRSLCKCFTFSNGPNETAPIFKFCFGTNETAPPLYFTIRSLSVKRLAQKMRNEKFFNNVKKSSYLQKLALLLVLVALV